MKKVKRIIILSLFIFVAILSFNTVDATSATISSNKTSMTVGQTATITVTIKAASWNLSVSGDASDTIVGYSDDGENTTKKETISFKPTKTGTYTIKLTGDITDGSTIKTTEVSSSVTIKVTKASSSSSKSNSTSSSSSSSSNTSSSSNSSGSSTTTTTKSSVATLSNLGITPSKYDFTGFKSATTSYSVSVPYEAEEISIYATATDSDAEVSGTGTKTLSVGENTYSIKVTAEDGKTTKTYTLVITRQEEEDDEDEEAGLTSLEVTGYTMSPEFSGTTYEYTVDVTGVVNSLDITTEVSSDIYEVEITGNEDLQEGENIITILVTNTQTSEVQTYQITVNMSNIDLTELNTAIDDASDSMDTQKWLILIIIEVILILIIIFLIQRYRLKKKLKNSEVDENEDNLIDNIYKLDEDFQDDSESSKNEELQKSTENTNETETPQTDDGSQEQTEDEYNKKRSTSKKGKRFK